MSGSAKSRKNKKQKVFRSLITLEPIVRIRFDRARIGHLKSTVFFISTADRNRSLCHPSLPGTDRQNSFRSRWLWNRSSEFVSIELALEPIVKFQILILPRLGPRPCRAVPPSGRAPALAKLKFAKFFERTNKRRTNKNRMRHLLYR